MVCPKMACNVCPAVLANNRLQASISASLAQTVSITALLQAAAFHVTQVSSAMMAAAWTSRAVHAIRTPLV